jgi:hypothetical protein
MVDIAAGFALTLAVILVVVRYSPLYESEEEEEGLWGQRRLWGGGTTSLLATAVPHQVDW